MIDTPPDILMCVGSEHYATPQQFIDEAAIMGVSKRLPMSAPPQGLVAGVSRIFFRHERACAVFGQSSPSDDPVAQAQAREAFLADLHGLNDEVVELTFATWQKQRKDQLHPDSLLYTISTWHRAAVDAVYAKHQVAFAPGVFGYSYFGGFALVTNEKLGKEIEVPAGVRDLPGPRAIRVKRVREEGQDE
jgi:hypothetical protein